MNERLRSLESLRPDFTIGVLGRIGVGKSTLSKELGRRLSISVIEENFGDNPHLPDFYRDPWRHAFICQTWFSTRKIEQVESVNGISAIIDPDEEMDEIYAEALFRMKYMNPMEWKLYQEECRVLKDTRGVKRSEIFLVVDAPTPVLVERIRGRRRPYELLMLDNFPNYLDVLGQTVKDWVARQPAGTPVILVDTGEHDLTRDKRYVDLIENDVINLVLQKATK